ncbi:hypothetical protein SAMN05444320_11086 [Streptoalloteichus hindustanus]|uniref:Uncharacterized protein n=1 Tax=Streptoalloteichus hindustanus TaxID=2017 RepID=A0A1M5KWT8_STRHI|nr:hypothetical protein SAMN05444320_11086 [Streptoalloteichus hindustanus]
MAAGGPPGRGLGALLGALGRRTTGREALQLSAAGRQRQDGSHISAFHHHNGMALPFRIGHSQAKLATTSPV